AAAQLAPGGADLLSPAAPLRPDVLAAFRATEANFANEFSLTSSQLSLLEATAYDHSSGNLLSQELAELSSRIGVLEQELNIRSTDLQTDPVEATNSQSFPQPQGGPQSRPVDR